MNNHDMKTIKIVVNGCGAVGKTCLLYSYATKTFPDEYVPTVFDNYAHSVIVDGEHYQVGLWDTAGGEEYHRLRPLSYPQTDVFLVCFSVVNSYSFQRVSTEFVPEIKFHCPGTPFLIVGNKVDLRNDIWESRVPFETNKRPITTEIGEKLAKDVGADRYLECSALTRDGVERVFDEAVSVAIEYMRRREEQENQKKKCCLLL